MSVEGVKAFFDVGTLVLLFLTFAFGAGAYFTGNSINKRQAAQLRQFDSDLTAAKTGLATAQSDLGKQRERAAIADGNLVSLQTELETQKEQTARAQKDASNAALELARFKAPRTLNLVQQENIAASLHQFGAQKVDMIVIGDGQEIANLAGFIGDALQRAGWVPKYIGKAISGPNISGVFIGTHLDSDANTLNAASALVSSLQSEGITCKLFSPQFNDDLPMAIVGTWDKDKVAPIRILVSAKP